MNIRSQTRLGWQKALGALAVFSGTICGMESLPAGAASLANQDSRESTEVALVDGVKEHNLSLDNAPSLMLANGHHHHGRRYSRGYMRKRFGRRHRRGHRTHGHHRRHHGRHHRRRGGFRKFKKFF
ncbi:MAG: hypothetical protein AAFR77_01025 [Cyanobacteria bacterium J06631_2]